MNYRLSAFRKSEYWEVYNASGDVLAYTATEQGAKDLIDALTLGATQRMEFVPDPVKATQSAGNGFSNHKTWE